MPSGIRFKQKGNFSKTFRFFNSMLKRDYIRIIERYGQKGVEELRKSTPKRTGVTSESWGYKIIEKRGEISLEFVNTNIQNGVNVAIVLRYGHGTKSGGYVSGIDYISPALKPIFDELANELWEEVRQ